MKNKFLIVGLLGLALSGLGQVYNKEYKLGLFFMIFTILGYVVYLPLGVILHIVSFSDSIIDKDKIEKENLYMFY